jgi:hypothetical protein
MGSVGDGQGLAALLAMIEERHPTARIKIIAVTDLLPLKLVVTVLGRLHWLQSGGRVQVSAADS